MTKEFKDMSYEEKVELVKHMLCPIRCGGVDHYDKFGRPWYIHNGKVCSPKEHNDVIRRANPTWTDEQLGVYLICDEDK
jgi:hypothetical protein